MECRYKLPCGWCDKFDKECKIECENRTLPFECDHDWIENSSYFFSHNKEIWIHIDYHCRRCGERKVEVRESYRGIV